MTKSLAAELGPRGITVNCVAPGWVATDMTEDALNDPKQRRKIRELIPLARVATAEEIAGRFSSWHQTSQATSPARCLT